jgi:hypothetical protein
MRLFGARWSLVAVLAALAAAAAVLLVPNLRPAVATGASASRSLPAASAQLAPTSATIPAKLTCDQVASLKGLEAHQRFPTAIASATLVPAAAGNPEYCDVKGMIAPQTHFELKLPTTTWQGRYLQNGCGGYCGQVGNQEFPACDSQLGGDFAMATDDEGHTTSSGLGGAGLFAFNDQTLREEYGYRSEHALAVIAKQIITQFYDHAPHRSYYLGCSDGGREAMSEAERYPTDFDGIIAGAPEIFAAALNAEEQTWDYQANTDANGNAILTSNKLPALHAAVIAKCVGDDGVDDGIITDPRNCDFDPATLTCPSGTDNVSCLTPAQVEVVEKLYTGVHTPNGTPLYPGGRPYGSELSWAGSSIPITPPGGGPVSSKAAFVYSGLSLPYLRYQLLPPGRLGPDPSEWTFDAKGFHSMYPVAKTYDQLSTDLTAFRAHGGKLIMWHGWADQGIPPTGSVDYYLALAKRMGGFESTQQFARLFMVPTVAHCGGGYASSTFDFTLALVNWVEQGQAPRQIEATDTIGGATLTRPIYPYPLVPKYKGSGPTDKASSFEPVVSPHANDDIHWIGDYLYNQSVWGPGQQPVS